MNKNLLNVILMIFCLPALAQANPADRMVVERDTTANVTKDVEMPYTPTKGIDNRTCIDGRPVAGFKGDIIEYWTNLECKFCGVQEIVMAQQAHPEWCIVVRHSPASGEGMKKALAYEGLKKFSPTAANMFWHDVVPKSNMVMPMPYEGALLRAYRESAIPVDKFSHALATEATSHVNSDILAAQGTITSTPTFILEGVRFPSCDFVASDLAQALELAKKARSGDAEAKNSIIQIITRGRMGEPML